MKFGKEIQSQQIPGWSQYYLDYKALKKIISAANKSMAETNSLLIEVMRPVDVLSSPAEQGHSMQPISSLASFGVQNLPSGGFSVPLDIPSFGKDEERGPEFQRSKAMFFFKLERELEKINAFYLQKEAELKLRLAILLSKRRAAKERLTTDSEGILETGGAEWRAVEEGFRSLDKDLSKLQQFIEINATGFRKILKKWDKRSKSRTKELYLARQVEVQPCFNRQLIAELSDTVAACLLDPENSVVGPNVDESERNDGIFQQQLALETISVPRRPFRDFEQNLLKAAELNDKAAVSELIQSTDAVLGRQETEKTHIMRVLWRVAILAPPQIADIIIASKPFDVKFVDDINGRTSLHEAAAAGESRLVDLCLTQGVAVDGQDVYGRTAIHYACINGHYNVAMQLLSSGADPTITDMDNHTALIYAIVKGCIACVRTLIESGKVSVGLSVSTNNLFPLSLACQHGHLDIAMYLLEKDAPSVPNTNGEYPIHLAAKEGHADVCRLLVTQKGGGFRDVPDKYSEWTPLFHAARHGHEECVKVLIETGANPQAYDEVGKTPVYYSSWNGHIKCTNQLLRAMASAYIPTSPLSYTSAPVRTLTASMSSKSPYSEPNISPLDRSSVGGGMDSDMDLDMIPSLSLPPPIMPFRVYGHNYLDQVYLLQIALGHPFNPPSSSNESSLPVRLLPSVMRHTEYSSNIRSSRPQPPALKIVMTLRSNDLSADAASASSHSATLPLDDPRELFSFQTKSLDDIALEFSFYPTFGSKAIGRAVASPKSLKEFGDSNTRSIPIFDHRLHVIGQVSFEAMLITPFRQVALEIGGAIETYWKSTLAPSLDLNSSLGAPSRATSTTSPENRSPGFSINANASTVVTLSSLSGKFVHAVVQVTRDLVPVVFCDWNLPLEDDAFDIGIADITVEQFDRLAAKLGRNMTSAPKSTDAASWHRYLAQSMCSLKQVIEVLPVAYGLSLELRYPNPVIRDRYHLGHNHEPNAFVDAVLNTIYSVSRSIPSEAPRRKIVFSSFVPAVCTAINWKQPNYAVFFASKCGVARGSSGSLSDLPQDEEEIDNRCRSVDAAIQFAKSNNLLGVILNASLLGAIPSLVQGIKEHGVVLAAFGSQAQLGKLMATFSGSPTETARVDATLKDGVLSYIDHATGF